MFRRRVTRSTAALRVVPVLPIRFLLLCIIVRVVVAEGITWEELSLHGTSADCWTVVDGIVFDVTHYIPSHPPRGGGPQVIVSGMCGVDGTALYNTAHSQEHYYLTSFPSIVNLGLVALPEEPTTTTTATTTASTTQSTSLGGTTPVVTTAGSCCCHGHHCNDDDHKDGDNSNAVIAHEQLQFHNVPDDCWTVYHGKVYDMTAFAPNHPIAGPDVIWEFCGDDGTMAYSIYHPEGLLSMVQPYYLGPYDSSTGDSAGDHQHHTRMRAMSLSEVHRHHGTSDCWTVMYGNVYDLTRYRHPGDRHAGYGQRVIYEYSCGRDSTRDYASVHPRDLLKRSNMDRYKIGWVTSMSPQACGVCMAFYLCMAVTSMALMW